MALTTTTPEAPPFEVIAGVIVAMGTDDAEISSVIEAARGLIGFYGSTPAYQGVLDAEGASDLQPELRQLTCDGRWDNLPGWSPAIS